MSELRGIGRRVACAVLVISAVWSAPLAKAQETRFDPEKHLPGRSLLWVDIAQVRVLESDFEETLIGRILMHPGWRRAYSPWSERIGPLLSPIDSVLESWIGRGTHDLLGLFPGGVTLSLVSIHPAGIPELVLAIETGDRTEEWKSILDHLRNRYREATGSDVDSMEIGGESVRVWRLDRVAVFETFVGSRLVLATTPDVIRDVQSLFGGTSSAKPIGESDFFREIGAGLGLEGRDVTFAINLEAIRSIAFPFIAAGGEETAEAREALKLSGVTRLTSLAAGISVHDGLTDFAAYLGNRDGSRGILEAFQSATRKLDVPDAFLRRVPKDAWAASGMRIAIGSFLREAHKRLTEQVPELRDPLEQGFREIESITGISVKDDLFTLGEIGLWTYVIPPPAGSLLADWITFVRTDELAPYWRLTEKVARRLGGAEAVLEGADTPIRYFDLAGAALDENGLLGRLLIGGGIAENDAVFAAMSLAVPSLAFARSEIDDGWTVLAGRAQSLWRYHAFYRRADRIGADSELASLVKREFPNAWCASVCRGSECFLAVYNSVVDLVGSFAPWLGLAGIRAAAIPPAEVFLEYARPGWMSLRAESHGFSIRGSSQLLPAIGVGFAGLIAAELAFVRTETWMHDK